MTATPSPKPSSTHPADVSTHCASKSRRDPMAASPPNYSNLPAFELRLRVALGSTLQLELEVENRAGQAFGFEEALHSYFAVSDVKQAGVRGLQGARYADKLRNMAIFTEEAEELRITGETDRVY